MPTAATDTDACVQKRFNSCAMPLGRLTRRAPGKHMVKYPCPMSMANQRSRSAMRNLGVNDETHAIQPSQTKLGTGTASSRMTPSCALEFPCDSWAPKAGHTIPNPEGNASVPPCQTYRAHTNMSLGRIPHEHLDRKPCGMTAPQRCATIYLEPSHTKNTGGLIAMVFRPGQLCGRGGTIWESTSGKCRGHCKGSGEGWGGTTKVECVGRGRPPNARHAPDEAHMGNRSRRPYLYVEAGAPQHPPVSTIRLRSGGKLTTPTRSPLLIWARPGLDHRCADNLATFVAEPHPTLARIVAHEKHRCPNSRIRALGHGACARHQTMHR